MVGVNDPGRDVLIEGVLRRLASSQHAGSLILRGGLLARQWLGEGARETEDIDFLSTGRFDPAETEKRFVEILQPSPEDDVAFADLSCETIWGETEWPGLRFRTRAIRANSVVGTERLLQIDVGFDDPLDPSAEWIEYRASTSPHPRILAVCPETAVAWKLHTLFERFDRNWLPKHLYDLHLLLQALPLKSEPLSRAIRLAFESRHTPLVAVHRLLDGDFGRSASSGKAWQKFLIRHPHPNVSSQLGDVVDAVAARLRPALSEILPPVRVVDAPKASQESSGSSPFPIIEDLSIVLQAISGRTEFALYQSERTIVVSYEVELRDTFPDPATAPDAHTAHLWQIRRECRGLTFNRNGVLIGRKIHKFFHWPTSPVCHPVRIDGAEPPLALEKLDGSMIAPICLEGELVWTTRRGTSEIADQAAEFIKAHPGRYDEFSRQFLDEGWTPLFEWCSRSHRLVIDYPEPRLVLTAVRHWRSGEYLSYDVMAAEAASFGVPVVKSLGLVSDIPALASEIAASAGIEGVVLRWPDGTMAKLKSHSFRQLHEVIEHNDRERPLLKLVLDGAIDDLLPALPAAVRPHAAIYAAQIVQGLLQRKRWLRAQLDRLHDELAGLDLSAARGKISQVDPELWSAEERWLVRKAWGTADPDRVLMESLEASLRQRGSVGLQRIHRLLNTVPWAVIHESNRSTFPSPNFRDVEAAHRKRAD